MQGTQLKFIADMHISPLTVEKLWRHGYNVIRISEKLPVTASDAEIVGLAVEEEAVIITQDLDFSAIVARSGLNKPSVIMLRVSNARPHIISRILISLLPLIEGDIRDGAIVSVDEKEFRTKKLPVN